MLKVHAMEGEDFKRLARLANQQRNVNDQITTPQDLFNWASENVTGKKCFYVHSQSVIFNEQSVERRMSEAISVRGCHSFYFYIQNNSFLLKASTLWGEDSDFNAFFPCLMLSLISMPVKLMILHYMCL
jgi:hypothetical protein